MCRAMRARRRLPDPQRFARQLRSSSSREFAPGRIVHRRDVRPVRPQHLSIALLTFNVGVEIGQLLVVTLALGLYRALARWPTFALARTPALYVIGTIAAYWSFGRVVSILSG